MPPRPSQGSQSWLAGTDNTLDNYFKSTDVASSSSTSKRTMGSLRNVNTNAAVGSGSKRKRDPSKRRNESNEVIGPTAKRAKIARSEDGHSRRTAPPKSKAKPKGKVRQALGDLTSALQNSPHRQRISTSNYANNEPKAVIQLDDDSSSEPESGCANASKRLPALTFGRTPSRPLKSVPNRLNAHLPTPPSSSMPPSRRLVRDERGSSPSSHFGSSKPRQSIVVEKRAAQTPFVATVTSSKRAYPTPTSIAVPRLNFTRPVNAGGDDLNLGPPLPLPAPSLNVDFDSDSPLTSLSSSSPARSIRSEHGQSVEDHAVCETKTNDALRVNTVTTTPRKDKGKSRAYIYEVIPSSQTQYIHYSPTKKKSRNDASEHQNQYVNPIWTRKNKAPSLTIIPCSQSQSQVSSSSFEVLLSQREGSQIDTSTTGIGITVSVSPPKRQRQRSVLNLVVPTSQEDEIEISLMDEAVTHPGFSQLLREYTGVDGEVGKERPNVATQSQQHIEQKSQRTNGPKDSGQNGRKEISPPPLTTGLSSQSTQMRFISAILDDLDRLAEETRLNTTTASQVLARPRPQILDSSSLSLLSERSNSRGQPRNLIMQSSITEPDTSQWEEDPFSLTNEAYARHLGLNISRRSTGAAISHQYRQPYYTEGLPMSQHLTCTQSSATQPDSDEEDPFPTLPPPPPPVPPSTAETSTYKGAGGSQTQSETESETENEDEDDDKDEDEDEAMSMPDITSPDDTFDFRLLSPREVRRVVERGMRFRRRDQSSFILRSSRRGVDGRDGDGERRYGVEDGGEEEEEEEEEGEGEEEGEEMPNTVREFFRMLDTQNQSLDWSQSQTQD